MTRGLPIYSFGDGRQLGWSLSITLDAGGLGKILSNKITIQKGYTIHHVWMRKDFRQKVKPGVGFERLNYP